MAVIRDYMSGPCRIIVHDDYIRPPEEIPDIIKRVSQIVLNEELRRNVLKKQSQGEEPTKYEGTA